MGEIEELRAKAIASMSSSSNPSSSAPAAGVGKSKSSESKEEGELSPFNDATAASEMPVCSPALSNSTVLEEHLSNDVVDDHAHKKSDCPPVKSLSSSSPSMVNAHIRSSVKRNYIKHFKKMQVPYKSTSNQSLSWHGKGSEDNLVISFSDDDSGSSSEESTPRDTISRKESIAIARVNKSEKPVPGKTISGKDNNSRGNKLEMPRPSVRVSSIGVQGGTNRSKYVLKRGLVDPASNPSVTRARLASSRNLATSAEKDSSIIKYSNINTSARQEHGHAPDPAASIHSLTNLRREISLRENELKVQSRSVPQSIKMNAGSYSDNRVSHTMLLSAKAAGVCRPASVADIGLAPRELTTKRLQPALGSNSKQSSADQFLLPISSNRSARECNLQQLENSECLHKGDSIDSCNDKYEKRQHVCDIITQASSESSLKVKDRGPFVPAPVTTCSTHEISPGHDNHGKLVAVDLHSCDKSENTSMVVGYPIKVDQRSHLLQSDPNTEDRALTSTEHTKPSNVSGTIDSSGLVPRKMPGQQSVMRTQQIVSTAGPRVPLKTSSLISERRSGHTPERKSGKDENTSLLNYSSQTNISGEASVSLQSLTELEDLQDKELEEAQELRHRCELEERHALKAYRKAQRALIDANEKCSLLYRRRELFSVQHRALLMQASSSMWPPNWQSHGGTVSDSVETLPEACKSLLFSLGHQLPVEGQIMGQLPYETNTRHSVEAQPHAICQQLIKHDFVSGQCWEQDASTSDQRNTNALDGIPDMSTDDENFPFGHRSVTEGNHGHRTANVNAEIKRLPSDGNAQDYELLEASLRSKLVKRFGHRISCNDTGESECLVQEHVPDKSGDTTKFPPLPGQQILEAEKTEMSALEGIEWLRRGTAEVTARIPSQDIEDSEFPMQTTISTLPSSVLHVVSRKAKSALLGCFSELPFNKEEDAMLCEKFTECAQNSTRFAKSGEMELLGYDFAINPFWPFCLFELRGKCNNEECRWQHYKDCTLGNLEHKDHSATSCSDGQANHLPSVGKSDDVFGPPKIPTYHVGSNLIKVDSHLSRSVLARSICQYWQRGFCASFSLPFSVQRFLPRDAPSLHNSDDPVADYDGWNKLSLYHHALDYPKNQIDYGLPESEQCLEMALDLFEGSVCKPDRKKALCMLSRAIEANPTAVAVWVVYLYIFYGKETKIGKDDMFFHAVQHNEGSYDLWLMYINSRMQLGDRLDAYEYALTTFYRNDKASEEERIYTSACILDIFLQMIDFLRMSGNTDKAIQKILQLLVDSTDTLLSDIHSCLIVSDRCIFWLCCTYLVIYRKLPDLILHQFELEKELPFGIEWPSVNLTPDAKSHALDLMKLAVDKMSIDIDTATSQRSLHFLAVSHIRCVAALEGLPFSTDLLATYSSVYPTCVELALMSARISGFDDALSNWPTQRLWNQYIEHALQDENILTRWFQSFCKETDLNLQGDVFGLLNLSLYRTLQKNSSEARAAINRALELSPPEDYKHCVREHAAFTFANEGDSWGVVLRSINRYLGDSRSGGDLKPLSRKYYRCIKKARVRQLIGNVFGAISKDFTIINAVLEECYGTTLVPGKIDDFKGFADFVEALMETTPANYEFALSVYKRVMNLGKEIRFWACSILINSVLQAVPVAAEQMWIEVANAIGDFEVLDICVGFYQQAVSVYPFSVKLWGCYVDRCRNTGKVDTIVESARERGIEVSQTAK